MKKTIICMVIVVLFVSPAICYSSYLIKMKNGGEFVTDQYWEENNHIRFYAYGGLLNFPKSDIHSITDSNLAVPKESISPSTSNESSSAGTSVNSPDHNATENTPTEVSAEPETTAQPAEEIAQKESIKKEAIKTQNEQLLTELDTRLKNTLEELREATRNRDEKGKALARYKLRELTNQIYDIKEKMESK